MSEEFVVRIRPTTISDLDFVIKTENHVENSTYILQWTLEEHRKALQDLDIAHFIVERISDRIPVGFVILLGLQGVSESIELTRTAFAEKGKGYGRQMLRLVKKWAFEEQKAHRLWLDVIDHNVRAKQLYLSEGFVEEGLKREAIKIQGTFESIYILSILHNEYDQ